MIPTRALREKAMQLLAADAATLAPAADGNVIALVMEAFTPSEATVVGDLTLATFDGATPIECGTGTQPEALDPANSDSIISMLPPVGGFRFETTGLTNLPQTIYGYVLLKNDESVYYAGDTFAEPITLTAVNQLVEVPAATLRQLAGSIS